MLRIVAYGSDTVCRLDSLIATSYESTFSVMQLPKRLARRLMDLQFLPHIVVTNPYIKRVYNAYHHAFNTLRQMPMVTPPLPNARAPRGCLVRSCLPQPIGCSPHTSCWVPIQQC